MLSQSTRSFCCHRPVERHQRRHRRLHHDSTCTEHSMPVVNISVRTDIGIVTDATDNTTGCRYGSTRETPLTRIRDVDGAV